MFSMFGDFFFRILSRGKGHWRICWTTLIALLLIMFGFMPPSLFLDHKRLFLNLRLCEWSECINVMGRL
ncbi:chlorophyll a-b binding protein 13 chloroplastic [Phtheirospermum japonicum]|uniref:Chlorophyll a-b binding protein 13 chloroplastic n=1 Tax=Phtheirospermum japonicum TaxID=374723 RepID=A0A830BE69_9LAMI|nr:chlorophyll a-b binding protein 13 chloroplastic [Phtheirospermum japonicum]